MSFLLRAIYDRTYWDRDVFPKWVAPDDLPSRIVSDLQAQDNALSMWEILDDEANLSQVITAIASGFPGARANFDYALLKSDFIDDVNFSLSKEVGSTAYGDANPYHRNVSNVSLHKVVHFAHLLCKNGDFRRTSWKEVRTNILDAHTKGKLDLSRVRKGLKIELKLA